MKFKTKYKLALYKGYLDKGMSLTNYFKYIIAFYALASQEIYITLIIGVVYGLTSFAVGYYWFKGDFMKAENEVQNQFNLFVKEMRRKLRNKKI